MMTTRTITWTALAGLIVTLSTSVAHASQEPVPKDAATRDAAALIDDNAKRSYAVGMNLGNAIRQQSADLSADLDVNLIVQGFRDAVAGTKTLLTEAEMRTILSALQAELKSRQALQRSEKDAKAKAEGEVFLAANKANEGVITLESGLQYKILKAGTGEKPTIDGTVVCHYRGTLIDGTEFDSSYKRNTPATFPLKKVIKGWAEALQLMPVGSTWQLFIPPSLAYGERGGGTSVPPNATLIFEVELLAIQDSAAAAAPDSPGIAISFKRDPRVSRGLYTGDVWLSLPFSQVGPDKTQVTVDARAEGRDAAGRPMKISPKWIPSDPDMLTVTPNEGSEVRITARRPGESRLLVTSQGLSKELAIKAAIEGAALVVEVSQKR